jgi:hypothetical protein
VTTLRIVAAALGLLLLATGSLAGVQPPQILVTFADPGLSRAARSGPVRPGYVRGRSNYLVSIDVRRAARRLEAEFGLRQVDEWPIDPLKVHCIVYAVDAQSNLDSLLAQLREQPRVESAQRMQTFDVLGSSSRTVADSYVGLQHNMEQLEVAAAHRWSRGGGSSVAIIDTGADTRHPDLRSQIDTHVDFVDQDSRRFDSDPHGTAVAGIIASSDNGTGIVGVAPLASISVLKACWYVDGRSSAVCNSFTLAKALSFAIESAAQIINLSLSGPHDPLLSRLVGRAIDDGKIVVAAAPSLAVADAFPFGIDGVIAVDSADREPHTRQMNTLFAPGDDILVPVPGGGFDYASGSSLSAAHVSGVVALLVARQPALTYRDVSALLAAGDGPSGTSVNACRALARLLNEAGCTLPVQAADGAN